jgi:hypothetical protein
MSRRGISLTAINPKYLPQIDRLLKEQARPPIERAQLEAPPAERRVKQSQRKVSLLEERWGRQLREMNPGARIYEQFPLNIGRGCNYYVDYLIAVGGHGTDRPLSLFADEVKGPYSRDKGITKLKAAATRYPWIKFSLVSEPQPGRWQTQEILP